MQFHLSEQAATFADMSLEGEDLLRALPAKPLGSALLDLGMHRLDVECLLAALWPKAGDEGGRNGGREGGREG